MKIRVTRCSCCGYAIAFTSVVVALEANAHQHYHISSVFTAQRVCIARIMPWQDVRPSICLSACLSVCHTPVFCRHRWTYSQFLFYRQVAHHSSFSIPNWMTILRRELPNGAVECKEVWKKSRFWPISRFVSEMMQDRAIVTMEGE